MNHGISASSGVSLQRTCDVKELFKEIFIARALNDVEWKLPLKSPTKDEFN